MLRAFTLVRNLRSGGRSLDFGEFVISRVGPRFGDLRSILASADVDPDDWVLEKSYSQQAHSPNTVAGDMEEILLLLRLYKPGDIVFSRLVIKSPGIDIRTTGNRIIGDLDYNPDLPFGCEVEDCQAWKVFAAAMRNASSWQSDWFAIAKRYFLYGGTKRFMPDGIEIDRISDYATALEAALVPEKDFNTRRLSRRGAVLVGVNLEETSAMETFLKKLYNIRSRVVHGGPLRLQDRRWLKENAELIEIRMREILVASLTRLPPGEKERRSFLAAVYEPSDEDHYKLILEATAKIKSKKVLESIVAEMRAGLIG